MTPVYIMRYKICVKRKLTQILSASVIIKVKIIRACFVSCPEHCSMARLLTVNRAAKDTEQSLRSML